MVVLVTGASGNVGSVVARELAAEGIQVRTTVHSGAGEPGTVRFDFTDPATWGPAFDGVDAMFLVRPPAIGNVERDLLPAVDAARAAGVEHVVFLSLQGAERNKVVPHAKVESWLRASGMAWTFVRASFFHQNLSTVHLTDVRDRDEIFVPAGHGATAFVDAADVGAVAAAALADREAHADRAWTVTGPRALTYDQVAQILTAELGRPIRYARPGLLRYMRHARRHLHMPRPMVAVTAAIYTTARLGLAAGLTEDVATVLGRAPVDFTEFAHRERDVWMASGPHLD
ncbi:SDR family oxidoreductase [Glycomyces endophyticus]|uniref:SDR family oxidoreductase n=1 Tax=Glycomyces endophyticus TaxID=480996 RepID=A0ABP4TAU7_9ACTN